MKNEGCLGRNYLKGRVGDQMNCVMVATGFNFKAILRWLKVIFYQILIGSFAKYHLQSS